MIAKYPHAVIVVMGCYAQMSHQFVNDIPGVHIIVGTSKRNEIPELVDKYLKTHERIDTVSEITRLFDYEPLKVISYSDNARAFLKIQDGCDNFCSYCIIPYARGKMRSRPKDDVLAEVHRLVDLGFLEIVLAGIHTAGYGQDLGDYHFVHLLRDILREEPRLYRLRISSIEESEIDAEFIELFKTQPVIARHLHIPLQSGSSNVLRRMNRKYDTAAFLSKLEQIREAVPDIAITTDVIVGFPGETDDEFQETYDFIEKAKFAQLHVFPFSARSGTPAARAKDQVDPATKKERVRKLIDLSERLHTEYARQFIGKDLDVIIEDFDEKTTAWRGHASNYLEAHVQSQDDLRGKVVSVLYKD
ncbi:MAG: tRNA (N(6)-L-threonylcarbamoyladenosine(37)-C(2))-methylthiotransferase MtaB [Firmicutes bacterium]|nr:tRNA (N(6)-L-threonylcarbamoyladenosine(37)-C(2))-methylthiotransferase MtaB [Bacillota bacterium]